VSNLRNRVFQSRTATLFNEGGRSKLAVRMKRKKHPAVHAGLSRRLAGTVLLALLIPTVCTFGQKDSKLDHIKAQVSSLALWGEKLNTPGMKMEVRESMRTRKEGKLLVGYQLYVTGAPTQQSYGLFNRPITAAEPKLVWSESYLAETGQVCMTSQPGCPSPAQFTVVAGTGEPFRLLLVSKDGKHRAAALIVPDPILGEDKTCSVEVVRVTPRFEVAWLKGKGFKPNSKIQYQSDSAGEVVRDDVLIDTEGTFSLVLLPSVKGKDKGVDRVIFKANGCAPVLSYKWGTTED
jgi:hypothetical protein